MVIGTPQPSPNGPGKASAVVSPVLLPDSADLVQVAVVLGGVVGGRRLDTDGEDVDDVADVEVADLEVSDSRSSPSALPWRGLT